MDELTVLENFKREFPHFNGKRLCLGQSTIQVLPELPNLESLDLEDSTIQVLPELPNLQWLDLGKTKMKVLPKLPKLDHVCIREISISGCEDWISLVRRNLHRNIPLPVKDLVTVAEKLIGAYSEY